MLIRFRSWNSVLSKANLDQAAMHRAAFFKVFNTPQRLLLIVTLYISWKIISSKHGYIKGEEVPYLCSLITTVINDIYVVVGHLKFIFFFIIYWKPFFLTLRTKRYFIAFQSTCATNNNTHCYLLNPYYLIDRHSKKFKVPWSMVLKKKNHFSICMVSTVIKYCGTTEDLVSP